MTKFLVLFMAPMAELEKWMQTDPAQRKASEDKMQKEWQEWTNAHKELFAETPAGAGKTKRVTTSGVADVKNDIMLYGVAEGESHEAVAKMFEGHPHFGIPEAWIEISQINPLHGMKGM